MTWFLAICEDCEPVLAQPFLDRHDRETWADEHTVATGHRVRKVEERR